MRCETSLILAVSTLLAAVAAVAAEGPEHRKLLEGEFEGICFNDSDVYKVLEGASYSLLRRSSVHHNAHSLLGLCQAVAHGHE